MFHSVSAKAVFPRAHDGKHVGGGRERPPCVAFGRSAHGGDAAAQEWVDVAFASEAGWQRDFVALALQAATSVSAARMSALSGLHFVGKRRFDSVYSCAQ